MEQRRKRGRPHKNDQETLAKMAELLIEEAAINVADAARKAVGGNDPSLVRRLQRKFKDQKDQLTEDAETAIAARNRVDLAVVEQPSGGIAAPYSRLQKNLARAMAKQTQFVMKITESSEFMRPRESIVEELRSMHENMLKSKLQVLLQAVERNQKMIDDLRSKN